MTSHTLPGIGLTGGYAAGDDGWGDAMNLNLVTLSAVAGCVPAKSRVTALPGSPADGDIYIVPHSAGTNPDKVAVRDAGAWVYLTPKAGWIAWVIDESAYVSWSGTAWAAMPIPAQPFDVGTYVAGTPAASEVVLRYVFTRSVLFADEFAGSQAKASTAATASTTFTVKKNGSSVGSVVFGISGSTGTFSTTGTTVTFAAGDVLELTAPASPDATLAGIGFTFAGTR